MIVVIDDERTFDLGFDPYEVAYLRTSQEALAWFAKYIMASQNVPTGALEPIEEIWFDHDLGEKSDDDAVTVAKFLDVMFWKLNDDPLFDNTKLFVHSQNPIGAQNVVNAFCFSPKEAVVVGLPPLLQKEPS